MDATGGPVPRILMASAALLAAATMAVAASAADGATIEAVRDTGTAIYFATDEPLLPTDTDSAVDVYERSGGTLAIDTLGDPACRPGCGNGPEDVVSPPRIAAFEGGLLFSTAEPLVAADTDQALDVYERTAAGLALVSQGPDGSDGPDDAHLLAYSPDGSTVVFSTAESLLAADDDGGAVDIYSRTAGTTTLVSRSDGLSSQPFDAVFGAASADASAVLFLSGERLLPADTDESIDLYERKGNVTTLVSQGAKGFNGPFDVVGPIFTSADGSRTIFSTAEELIGIDEDEELDIFSRGPSAGTTITQLVSQSFWYNGFEGSFPAFLEAANGAANLAIFSTRERLDEDDYDMSPDIYERFGGQGILVSQGSLNVFTPAPIAPVFLRFVDGPDAVFFSTAERLEPLDQDSSPDIYERRAGATQLISTGPSGKNEAFEATLADVSADGDRVDFFTAEQLSPADQDHATDLYERSGGATRLISVGQVNGNGDFDVTPFGGTARSLFGTAEELLPGDTDDAFDLYSRVGERTSLISTAKPDPAAPALQSSSPASPANDDSPLIRGTAEPGSTVELFAGSGCSGPPLAAGGAEQFASPGLEAAVADNSVTEIHALAVDANGNAGPCSGALDYVEDSRAAAPVLDGVTPRGPANDNSPRLHGSGEEGAAIQVFADAGCLGAPIAGGSSAQLGAEGIAVPVADNSTTTLRARLVDAAGNVSPCSSAGPTYSEDSSPPETSIAAGPRRTHDRTPTFSFASSERPASFSCRVDGRKARPCPSPFTLPRLSFAQHSIAVVATDAAGNTDPSAVVRSLTISRKQHRRHGARR